MTNLQQTAKELPDYIYDMMEGNERLAYFEVFQEENEEELNFDFSEDEEYLIDDQHFLDPASDSPVVRLSFINFGEGKKEPFTEFSADFNLKNFEYEIRENRCTEEKAKEVMEHIITSRWDLLKSIKRRNSEMKEIGRELKRLKG